MTGTRRSAAAMGVLLLLAALMTTALAACGGNDSPDTTNGFGFSANQAAEESGDGSRGPAGGSGPPGTLFSGGATATAAAAPALPGREARSLDTVIPAGGYGVTQEQWQRLLESNPELASEEDRARIQSEFEKLSDAADAQQVLDYRVANVQQVRIIVRTVDMEIEVANVPEALRDIGNVATGLGGWVVSSNQQRAREGFISVRVPAADLDVALEQIRTIASNINAEVATSQDFTEEYTDVAARIDTLERTLESLRALFEQADSVEEAISVQNEITRVQSDLEARQARLSFLEQSSAYSLVKIEMSARPADVEVRAGEDLIIAEGRPHLFQARFTPPEGIDDYVITWNFGDGSNARITDRVAPTTVEGEFITSPVGHIYESEDSSPFIVTVEINGTGQGGVIKGKDTLVATVQRIPAIEVFAGENQTADEGRAVEFRGSFTRPEGITDLKAEWNFGDGSAPVEVELDEGVTVVDATHVYDNYRPSPYLVSLKVFGSSPAGEAEGADQLQVQIRQPDRISASGFDAGNTTKNAAQALTNVATALATFGIWLAILSPIWLAGLVMLFFSRRRMIRRKG